MRKNVFILLCVLVAVSINHARAQTPPQSYDVSFTMSGIYAPARFVMEFAYSVNFSGPINMATLSGQSLWTATISPLGFEFNAKDVDTYSFDVHLIYNSTIEQVITISYWSGTLPPNSIRYYVVGKELWVHFDIVANTEPQIPSKEAIAQAVVLQVKQDLQDYMGQISELTAQFQENLLVVWALIGLSVLVCLIALVVSFYAIRSSHQPGRR